MCIHVHASVGELSKFANGEVRKRSSQMEIWKFANGDRESSPSEIGKWGFESSQMELADGPKKFGRRNHDEFANGGWQSPIQKPVQRLQQRRSSTLSSQQLAGAHLHRQPMRDVGWGLVFVFFVCSLSISLAYISRLHPMCLDDTKFGLGKIGHHWSVCASKHTSLYPAYVYGGTGYRVHGLRETCSAFVHVCQLRS